MTQNPDEVRQHLDQMGGPLRVSGRESRQGHPWGEVMRGRGRSSCGAGGGGVT